MAVPAPPANALRSFISHKRVQAAKIIGVEPAGRADGPEDTILLILEPGVVYDLPSSVIARHTPPVPGDYLVVYEGGYLSTVQAAAFEGFYTLDAQKVRGHNDIGWAVKQMRDGERVCRAGWNGKGMFIALMPSLYLAPFNDQDAKLKVNDRTAKHIGRNIPLDSQPYIAMWTATKQWQPGWLCSQADLLATDWVIADPLPTT